MSLGCVWLLLRDKRLTKGEFQGELRQASAPPDALLYSYWFVGLSKNNPLSSLKLMPEAALSFPSPFPSSSSMQWLLLHFLHSFLFQLPLTSLTDCLPLTALYMQLVRFDINVSFYIHCNVIFMLLLVALCGVIKVRSSLLELWYYFDV